MRKSTHITEKEQSRKSSARYLGQNAGENVIHTLIAAAIFSRIPRAGGRIC
jgi:hypothetical protein